MEAITVTALALLFINSVKEVLEIAFEKQRRKKLKLIKTNSAL